MAYTRSSTHYATRGFHAFITALRVRRMLVDMVLVETGCKNIINRVR
jgi:hypothetical protein